MNLFGLHTFAIAPLWDVALIEPRMAVLREHGVGLLEIPLLRPAEIDIPAARAFAQRHGVELACSLGLPASLDIVARPDEALAFLETALDVTERLGCRGLTGVTYGTIGKISGRPVTEAETDAICRLLQRAGRAAYARHLALGIEPCNRYETHLMNRGQDAAAILERVGARNLFIHLDTYHMHIEEESFLAGFQAAAPFLGYVHLAEANRGVPGRGQLDWGAALRALAAIGYQGPLTLESMNRVDPDTASGLAIWRPVAADPEDVVNAGVPFLRKAAFAAGLSLGRG